MATVSGTNVFFVQYDPTGTTKTEVSASGLSQQKHAAREYHRKAKLRRLAKGQSAHKRQSRESSEGVETSREDELSIPRPPVQNGGRNRLGEFEPGIRMPVGLGAGELDPFNVCIPRDIPPYAREMLSHAISYQWPVFSASKTQVAVGNIKNAVLGCAMYSPATFYTIVYAGACHNAFAHKGVEVPIENKMLRLSYKTQAIKALNEEIRSLKGDAADELILAVITMGAHGSGEYLEPPPADAKLSPLATAQNFLYYGSMRWETAHVKAIRALVQQKGGLRTLRMPGLANAIELADIFISFQHLCPPSFPLMVPSKEVMKNWPRSDSASLSHRHRTLGSGFGDLPDESLEDPLFAIIDTIRDVTIGFDNWTRGQSGAPSFTRILWARNSLQHDLISLPSRSQDSESIDSCVYEICRLATMAYMLCVLFPLPRRTGIHRKLAHRIMLALDNCTAMQLWDAFPELLLWATILGGVMAESSTFRSWFINMSSRSPVKQVPGSWTLVKGVVGRFLWYDQDCDPPAEEFWVRVCRASHPIECVD